MSYLQNAAIIVLFALLGIAAWNIAIWDANQHKAISHPLVEPGDDRLVVQYKPIELCRVTANFAITGRDVGPCALIVTAGVLRARGIR